MKDQKDIKKVYLLDQNYSHGQQVAKYAKEDLKRKRPDVQIVGEDLHPLGQVRDFAPYIAKIKAVGRRHRDHRQLGLRPGAAGQGGRTTPADTGKFYTYYAGVTGTPTALGANGAGKVYHGRLRPLQHGRRDRQVTSRSSRRSSTTTSTPARSSASRGAARGDGQGQVDRSGEGGQRDGRPEVSRASTATSRCARPTTSCSSRCTSRVWQKADAKNPYSVENTGITFAPVDEYPSLRVEHADELPDEAAVRALTPLARLDTGPSASDSGSFVFSAARTRHSRGRWSSSPSRC